MAERLYSTTELSELIGTSRQHANQMVKGGKIFPNFQRIGRSYAVPASDAKAYIVKEIAEVREKLAILESGLADVEAELAD